jgi:hypothetical protein
MTTDGTPMPANDARSVPAPLEQKTYYTDKIQKKKRG